ncbi:unnamed protein product [Closterium sp. Naga37s-1]|nr:unnamed protein product [Closterium sp. Naga37s-1]
MRADVRPARVLSADDHQRSPPFAPSQRAPRRRYGFLPTPFWPPPSPSPLPLHLKKSGVRTWGATTAGGCPRGAICELRVLSTYVRLSPAPLPPRVQKMLWVGGNNGQWLSPWGFKMKGWKGPKVLPGDLLVFQWAGEVHSVHKVDVADYTACTFLNAKTLARTRNYGEYIYKVVPKDYGNTIYFTSKANNDCSDGIKASFTVG